MRNLSLYITTSLFIFFATHSSASISKYSKVNIDLRYKDRGTNIFENHTSVVYRNENMQKGIVLKRTSIPLGVSTNDAYESNDDLDIREIDLDAMGAVLNDLVELCSSIEDTGQNGPDRSTLFITLTGKKLSDSARYAMSDQNAEAFDKAREIMSGLEGEIEKFGILHSSSAKLTRVQSDIAEADLVLLDEVFLYANSYAGKRVRLRGKLASNYDKRVNLVSGKPIEKPRG